MLSKEKTVLGFYTFINFLEEEKQKYWQSESNLIQLSWIRNKLIDNNIIEDNWMQK